MIEVKYKKKTEAPSGVPREDPTVGSNQQGV
jgi:hypothetical protein